MMEESNDIFLAGGDASVYLAVPMYKTCSTGFVWGHPFSTYVSYDQFFKYRFPCKFMYAFRVTVSAVGLFQKILINTFANMY